jgi:MFS family permease
VVGQALVTDIYLEERRGLATAFFYMPFNVGPVIGPLIGGPLARTFDWRSAFIFLSIFAVCVLAVMFFIVPETHQYYEKERFHKVNPRKRIIDAEPNELMPFEKTWIPLTYLADLAIVPYIAVMTTTFATLYTSLTLFSTYLSKSPYNYTETIIGVLFVPWGVAMFATSLISRWLSDKASKYYGHEKCPEGRLVSAFALSILHPIGLAIYGWTFHYKLIVAGPIIGGILLSIGQAILEPALSAYLTVKKQKEAGAVCAANIFLSFCAAGIIVTIDVPLENAMQARPYFSLMCGINIISISLASIIVYKSVRRANHVTEQQNGTTLKLKNPA